MSLAPGMRLGSYEIVALLGAGGMGQVYRARDTRLKRDVAIKILPAAFARDPDRIARLQREAEVLATLNHPNIAAVYGFEETPVATGIVLAFVLLTVVVMVLPAARAETVTPSSTWLFGPRVVPLRMPPAAAPAG